FRDPSGNLSRYASGLRSLSFVRARDLGMHVRLAPGLWVVANPRVCRFGRKGERSQALRETKASLVEEGEDTGGVRDQPMKRRK
ncbi:MAG TPA: hypothetical protein PKA58_31185, partial [Polyangium sp.]|nr:hypothetical protein [Polyangium sp.]